MTEEFHFSSGELQRLLGRPVETDVGPEERAALAGRRVLITGAGGSIGSALAREAAACDPEVLGVLEQSEIALFAIERELRERWPGVPVVPILADVRHRASVERACRDVRPHAIYHAAAYKHVTMVERAPAAAAHVNVIGTQVVARAAAGAGARFVLISSDKAADPKSVMGATKRLAERVALASASRTFRPIVVRFGNVLGSSGSALQIMRGCVRRGVPLPLTDPDATRFYMTPTEAVALVLRADRLGRVPEIFWLEMGEPVRLGDLADRLIAIEREEGHRPVPIDVIGLRAGEKRHETLSDASLTFERTIDARIRVARDTAIKDAVLAPVIRRLRDAIDRADDGAVVDLLAKTVNGFQPSAAALEASRRTRTAAIARPRRRRSAA